MRRRSLMTRAPALALALTLPAPAAAHGHHGLVHIVTLHFLPWLRDWPLVAALCIAVYAWLMWAAWGKLRKLSGQEEAAQQVAEAEAEGREKKKAS